ncbi:hypothetical protein ACO2Q3_24870 [Caulobacter sp. KR2-114]|uniref:hypothetical protein n=1 Tax=Caulobacter sp. KR2-114 TaxID=3400912 RepID=UPI003C09C7B5
MNWLRTHWIWLVGPRDFTLTTSLNPAACTARLKPQVGSWMWPLTDAAVVGWVGDGEARLRRRLTVWRNDFRPELHLMVLPDSAGSRVRCRLGLGRGVWMFAVVWVAVMSLGGILPMASHTLGFRAAEFAAPLAFLYLLALVGRLTSRDDDRFLLRFVANRLDATPVGGRADA